MNKHLDVNFTINLKHKNISEGVEFSKHARTQTPLLFVLQVYFVALYYLCYCVLRQKHSKRIANLSQSTFYEFSPFLVGLKTVCCHVFLLLFVTGFQ